MSAVVVNEVRKGFYLDSVALMRLSRSIAGSSGIEDAALMMGTPANKQILEEADLLAEAGRAAKGNDLIVAVRAEADADATAALEDALRLLEAPRAGTGNEQRWRPRTLGGALSALPEANLALVSVPGPFAATEARKALGRGLHVMIFSDNVELADERALKEEARARGLLVMGPDCGTAILGGVPLAFSNRVPRGDIGIIGASGTGMQEVSSLIARSGGGISQAIGVGGRDLSKEIGAISTLMALEALDRDPATRRIVLISKPPAPEVARRIAARVAESTKPFTLCFIGARPFDPPDNARLAPTLKAAAEDALGGAEIGAGFDTSAAATARRQGAIVGLFSGGTLCAEAQIVLAAASRRVASNAPVPGAEAIEAVRPDMASPDMANRDMHRLLDLGADQYTRGRPHPMIDPAVRDEALKEALGDAKVAVVLLDLVLGFGAHGDPAGHLARVLAERPAGGAPLVASVTGTEDDPQVRSVQVAKLERAGVLVAPSNAQAAALALALCDETT
jgi:FdrA protein